MLQLVIRVDGQADEAYDLHLWLKESIRPRDAEFTISSSPGALGAVDTVLSSISTAAALAGLAVSIMQWRRQSGTKAIVELHDGREVALESADPQVIGEVWEQLTSEDDDDEQSDTA